MSERFDVASRNLDSRPKSSGYVFCIYRKAKDIRSSAIGYQLAVTLANSSRSGTTSMSESGGISRQLMDGIPSSFARR